jgi:hypothetical protein
LILFVGPYRERAHGGRIAQREDERKVQHVPQNDLPAACGPLV